MRIYLLKFEDPNERCYTSYMFKEYGKANAYLLKEKRRLLKLGYKVDLDEKREGEFRYMYLYNDDKECYKLEFSLESVL